VKAAITLSEVAVGRNVMARRDCVRYARLASRRDLAACNKTLEYIWWNPRSARKLHPSADLPVFGCRAGTTAEPKYKRVLAPLSDFSGATMNQDLVRPRKSHISN
jgi:hypothetical protein